MVEDVSTGVTPKKKVWNVPTSWERTEPRDVLIQALRQRKQAGLPAVQDQQEQPLHASGSSGSVGSGIDSSLHRANSTISLVSSNSGSEAFMPVDDYEVPSAQVQMTTGHPVHLNHPDENINALSDSTESRPATRMRIPSASMKGLKGEIEVERRKTGLTVLGEGGNNIPRRTKR
jgi:kinesin family protein 11